MEFIIDKKETYTVFRIQGEEQEAEPRDKLANALQACVAQEIVLAVDLSQVTYVNSQLLSVFLRAYKIMERKNGRFAIFHPTQRILDLLHLTALDKILPIFQDEKTFSLTVKNTHAAHS